MKTEMIELRSNDDLVAEQVEQDVDALRALAEAELMLIGGGGGDVVFG